MNQNKKYGFEPKRDSSGEENWEKVEYLVKKLTIPTSRSKEEAWQAIFEKIGQEPKVKTFSLLTIGLKVAASLVLLFTLGCSIWIWGFSRVNIYCPKGQHISELLPDSSQIQLNADTRITYNKALWFISRKVYITGEALFKVKKGKRFDVIADMATTTVLGTTFDVYARNGKVKVSCIEGRVSVTNNVSNNKVILTAGLHTQATQSKITTPAKTIRSEEIAWTYGEFYFNNALMIDVLKEIERQFNVDIQYKSHQNRYYTGYFNNKDLNDALRLVCIPMNLMYSVNEKTIEIKQLKK